MLIFIFGGSASGKSEYAETVMLSISEEKKKYYIATMQPYGTEGKKRIERHKRLRHKKGFCTIEQYTDVERAKEKMECGEKTALLECISNLTANEMFSGTQPATPQEVTEKIISGIKKLEKQVNHLVIVSSNVFEDGTVYDETTMEYITAMGQIHARLAELANEVVEVVAGIGIVIKKE